ncbi:DUF6924 domain-containing protein [Deinococcus yunweiensis]|uniref:DUF6924 domain-containing protein n=1 Tax=Deinococcus yunweiensis TaxID=367282 RepID=UPI00398F11C8
MRSSLPEPDDLTSLLIRADYSNEAAWQAAFDVVAAPVLLPGLPASFRARFTVVQDVSFGRLTMTGLHEVLQDSPVPEVFVADHLTVMGEEHTLLVVRVAPSDRGATESFRVAPSFAWAVQNNLSLANMDFLDFLADVDSDGVYRGGASSLPSSTP